MIWQNELLTYVRARAWEVQRAAERHAANESFEMNVVRFRTSDATAFAEKRVHASTSNICELLDLSRYELSDRSRNDLDLPEDSPDDFEHRMRANIVALIFLVALVALAVTDVLKLAAYIS